MADIKIDVNSEIINAIQEDLRNIELAHKSEVDTLKTKVQILLARIQELENPLPVVEMHHNPVLQYCFDNFDK